MKKVDDDTSYHASRSDVDVHDQHSEAPTAGSHNLSPLSHEGADEYGERLKKVADYRRLQARKAERLVEYSRLPVATQGRLVMAYGSLGQAAEHDIRNSDRANAALGADERAPAHSSYNRSKYQGAPSAPQGTIRRGPPGVPDSSSSSSSSDDDKDGDQGPRNNRSAQRHHKRTDDVHRSPAHSTPQRDSTPHYYRDVSLKPQSGHRDNVAERHIRAMVHEALAVEIPELPKGFKIAVPKRYNGSSKSEDFEMWLAEFLGWLQMTRLTGHDMAMPQIIAIGSALSDVAAEWYNREVRDPDRRVRIWDLESIVVALHRRFLYRATVQDAAAKFRATKYDPTQGVVGFYNELQVHATRMVEPPNQYAFNHKFLVGLPPDIVKPMMYLRGVTAEFSATDDILQAAVEIQEANEFVRRLPSRFTASTNVLPSNTVSGTTRVSKAHVVSQTRPQSGGLHPQRHGAHRSSTNDRRHSMQPAHVSPAKHVTIKPPVPPTKQRGGQSNDRNVDPTQITCWGCGKKGHYANDPVCSQYGKAGKAGTQRVFAVTASDPEGIDGDEPMPQVVGASIEDASASADASALMATSVLDDTSTNDVQSQVDDPAHDDPAFDGSQYDDSSASPAEEEYHTDDEDNTQYLMGMHLGSAVEHEVQQAAAYQQRCATYVADHDDALHWHHWTFSEKGLWMYDPSWGIIHHDGCHTCMQYVEHCHAAADDATSNFQQCIALCSHLSDHHRRRGCHDGHGIAVDAIRSLARLNYGNNTLALAPIQRVLESVLGVAPAEPIIAFPEMTDPRYDFIFGDIDEPMSIAVGSDSGDATESEYADMPPLIESGDGIDIPNDYTDFEAFYGLEVGPSLALDRVYRSSARRPYAVGQRPTRSSEQQACLAIYVDIGGHRALTLFDTGSTTDIASPEYSRVAGLDVFALMAPVPLQLGCVGSRSSINYGVTPHVAFGPVTGPWYFDVANIDRYDVILGMPFMTQAGVTLDLTAREIRVGSSVFPALKVGEDPRMQRTRVKKLTQTQRSD